MIQATTARDIMLIFFCSVYLVFTKAAYDTDIAGNKATKITELRKVPLLQRTQENRKQQEVPALS